VIIPFHVTKDFTIRHSLDEIVQQTDREMQELGKNARWGAIEKSLEFSFKAGNSKFGEFLYDNRRAKEIYGKKILSKVERVRNSYPIEEADKRLLQRLFKTQRGIINATQKSIDKFIEEHCYFNSYLTALAYKTIIDKLGIKNPVLYSRNSHFSSSEIFKKIELMGIKLDKWARKGIMRNAELSQLGESDPRALNYLKERLYLFFEEKLDYGETEKEYFQVPNIPKFEKDVEIKLRPKLCTFCNRLRCRHVDRCRYEKEQEKKRNKIKKQTKNCVYDYSQNRFTKKDVAELIERFGLEENVDELYDELRFKEIEVKFYDAEKKEFVIRKANEFDLLIEDATNEGYTLADIPLDISVLNSKFDEDINLLKKNEWLSTSWVKFSNGMIIKPLPVLTLARENPNIETSKDELIKFMVRGSEFASKCHIGRLIAKMDKEKFPIHENFYAAVGNARHKLANKRPWLEYLDKDDLHVEEYCEHVVAANINGKTIKGHGDGFFEMIGPDKKYLFVLDYKRAKKGAYEKPAYLLQLIQYAKGVQQMVDRKYDGTVLCLVKRFFHGEPEGENWPEYSLFFIPENGENEITLSEIVYDEEDDELLKNQQVSGVSNLIEKSIEIQNRLLQDKRFFWKYASLAANCNFCYNHKTIPQFRECFNKKICDIIKEKIRKNESIGEYFLPGFEL